MRKNDFSQTIKKISLKRASYKCERCWSERDLEFHHKIPISIGGDSSYKNCIILCHSCHISAPKDQFLFENFFLRLASTKELLKFYNASNEIEAIKLFCNENRINFKEIKRRIGEDPLSHKDAIKKGIKHRVERIGHSGFNIPYGYDYKDHNLILNTKESKVVKEIFSLYLKDKSMGEISEMLNNSKIQAKKGGLWTKKTISTILKNPVYCG